MKEPSGETPTQLLIRHAPKNHEQTDRLDVKTRGSLMAELRVKRISCRRQWFQPRGLEARGFYRKGAGAGAGGGIGSVSSDWFI